MMYEEVIVHRASFEEKQALRDRLVASGLPYFPADGFDEAIEEIALFVAFNDAGFCGAVAVKEGALFAAVCPGTLHEEFFTGTRILGAFAPEENHVRGLVGAMADCAMHEIASQSNPEHHIGAVIVGLRRERGVLQSARLLQHVREGDYGDPRQRGRIHPDAAGALRWAQENRMRNMGFDPLTLGPVFVVQAKQVNPTFTFVSVQDGLRIRRIPAPSQNDTGEKILLETL